MTIRFYKAHTETRPVDEAGINRQVEHRKGSVRTPFKHRINSTNLWCVFFMSTKHDET